MITTPRKEDRHDFQNTWAIAPVMTSASQLPLKQSWKYAAWYLVLAHATSIPSRLFLGLSNKMKNQDGHQTGCTDIRCVERPDTPFHLLKIVQLSAGAIWLHLAHKKIWQKKRQLELPSVQPSATAPSMAMVLDAP